MTRFMDELGRNPRVTDALARAFAAKGRVDESTRRVLAQIGLAPADEVKQLQLRLEDVERRLANVEGEAAAPARRTSARAGTTRAQPVDEAGAANATREPSSASTTEPGPAAPG
ncbi:MAG: hypothetical protein M3123_05080 [Actinomycetota bacterium]|nr:hypothetical protein [Actinomycetota bacterium]